MFVYSWLGLFQIADFKRFGKTHSERDSVNYSNAAKAMRAVMAGEPFLEPLNCFWNSRSTILQGIKADFITQRLFGSR